MRSAADVVANDAARLSPKHIALTLNALKVAPSLHLHVLKTLNPEIFMS